MSSEQRVSKEVRDEQHIKWHCDRQGQ